VWNSLVGLRRAIAAPVPGVADAGTGARILKRLAAEPTARAAPGRTTLRMGIALATSVAAIAAGVALAPRLAPDRPPGVLTARGGKPERSLRRDVGVIVHRGGDRLVPLRDGDAVDGETIYSTSYRNLGEAGAAFLMVFAVDAAGAVHWIHPAYVDAKDDPGSVPLVRAISEELLPSGAVLSAPSMGPLRVVTLVTARPLKVSQIEALSAKELSLAALRERFPAAEIAEIAALVTSTHRPE
jgi:hypothetical protein